MLIEVPDHFVPTIASAMIFRAVTVINRDGYVPSFLHQYAEAWDCGVRYEDSVYPFWEAVRSAGGSAQTMKKAGVL